MEDNNYTYKRLEEKYLPDLKIIFRDVFNKEVSINYLRNKYNTDYLGVSFISFMAFHNNKAVAFYGAIPQKFRSETQTFLVAHACDSFTRQEHQKKGLHYNLAIRAYELMRKYDIKFVYAFHSENTFHSTKKLEWKNHLNMKRFHINIFTLPISKVCIKLKLQNIYHRFLSIYLKKIIVDKSNFKSETTKGEIYNEAFFDYKDGFNNHFLLLIENSYFYIKIDEIMRVGFFKCSNDIDFKKAIIKLKKIAFVLGINEILFQVSPNTMQFNYLNKLLSPKDSWLIGYLMFCEDLKFSDFEFTYANLDTF